MKRYSTLLKLELYKDIISHLLDWQNRIHFDYMAHNDIVGKQLFLCFIGGNADGTTPVDRNLITSAKIVDVYTHWPSNPTPTGKVCTGYLWEYFCNSKREEAIQMFIKMGLGNKLWYVHTMQYWRVQGNGDSPYMLWSSPRYIIK